MFGQEVTPVLRSLPKVLLASLCPRMVDGLDTLILLLAALSYGRLVHDLATSLTLSSSESGDH